MIAELASNASSTLMQHTGTITVSLKGTPNNNTVVSIDYGGGQGAPNITLSDKKTYQVISITANKKVTITNHGPQTINLSWKS